MNANSRDWLLDAGNTRLKLARADDVAGVVAIANNDPAFADRLRDALRQAAPDERAWWASVAPADVSAGVESALREAGLDARRVRSVAVRGRLRVAYADPSRLGVDRFLALLAASERGDGPWLLVSAGSALTVDLLREDGQHLGGLIAPMPDTTRAALASRFDALDVPMGAVRDFAADTADAVASGCAAAALGLVERSLRLARERLGVEPTLLLTGGASAMFETVAAPRRVLEPSLVLAGLAAYARAEAG